MQSPDASRQSNTSWIAILVVALAIVAVLVFIFFLFRSSGTPTTTDSQNTPASPSQRYEDSIESVLFDYENAVDIIKTHYSAATEDPSLLLDTAWKSEIDGAGRLIRAANSRIESLTPPSGYTGAHEDYLLMAESYDSALQFLEGGIESLDAAALVAAINSVTEAAEYKSRADAQMP